MQQGDNQEFENVQMSALNAQKVRLTNSAINNLTADSAQVSGLVEKANGAHIELNRALAGSLSSKVAKGNFSLAGSVQSGETEGRNSAACMVFAKEITGERCLVGLNLSKQIALNQSAAGVVAGQNIKVENGHALLLLSPKVEGNISTVIDTKRAVIIGACAGIAFFCLRALSRLFIEKHKDS